LEAYVTYEDGTKGRYILCTFFGSVLDAGDHVLVLFSKEDQFARVISMDEAASRFQETLVQG